MAGSRRLIVCVVAVAASAAFSDVRAMVSAGTAASTDSSAVLAAGTGVPAHDSYVVVYDETADSDAITDRLEAAGAEIDRVIDPSADGAVTGAVVRLSPSEVSTVSRDPDVLAVARNEVVSLDVSTPGGTQSAAPWGLDRIDQRDLPLNNTFGYAANGAGVTVYVVDSGVRADHVEFSGRVASGAYINDGNGPTDCNGHGTHVAGTIGSTTYGVAKGVTIVPIRVLGCSGSGTSSGIVTGINWAIANHRAGAPAVLNMSVGGDANAAIDAAVQAAVDDGITVVVAAGNESTDACTKSPARAANALTVGATTTQDAMASFSNRGACVDLFAPGVSVLSTWSASTTATASLSGTSMASPHVAGVAALMLQQQPGWTPSQVAAGVIGQATANHVTGLPGATANRLLFAPPAAPPSGATGADVTPTTPPSGPTAPPTSTTTPATTPTPTTTPATPTPLPMNPQPQPGGGTGNATFQAVPPVRLADTRPGGTTIDGIEAGTGFVGAGDTLQLVVAGRAGVPADATAVALNVTVTETAGAGFTTIYPCGAALPTSSNINTVAGMTRANAVVSKIGAGGTVCLYSSAGSHFVVDLNGIVPSGSPYAPLTPARLFDSRAGTSTIDGVGVGAGVRVGTTEIVVAGRGGVPVEAVAAVLTVTATGAATNGYAVVYPCGQPRPLGSNLNVVAGGTIANAVVAKLGAGGTVCVSSSTLMHIVVDVAGWFPASNGFLAITPARLGDTRPDGATIDGTAEGLGLLQAGAVIEIPVAGRAGVPVGAGAFVLNVTVTEPGAAGYASVYPCGSDRPTVSNLNVERGDTIANAVLAKAGSGGRVCVYVSMPAHVVVDVTGYFPA